MGRKKTKHKDQFRKFDGKNYVLYRKTRSHDIATSHANMMRNGGYFARITEHPRTKTFRYKVWLRKMPGVLGRRKR